MINLEKWLKIAVEKKASDIHFSSGAPPMIRLDGKLISLSQNILDKNALYNELKAIIPEGNSNSHDGDFSFSLKGCARFRVNYFSQMRGISAVFRIIPESIPTLESIQAPEILKKLAQHSHGLILLTGSTGSGKSTTMAAMTDYINQHFNKHIITIESPIEFVHTSKNSLIQQREVHEHTQSFENALRAALREDPDIIIVGEMRDIESIRLALTAAETGHLVISTLHTNSAVESIDRIINVFPSGEQNFIRHMLALSLNAIISQELLNKKEGGRVAAHEILIANSAVRNLIRENKLHQLVSVMQMSKKEGMITRDESIKKLTL